MAKVVSEAQVMQYTPTEDTKSCDEHLCVFAKNWNNGNQHVLIYHQEEEEEEEEKSASYGYCRCGMQNERCESVCQQARLCSGPKLQGRISGRCTSGHILLHFLINHVNILILRTPFDLTEPFEYLSLFQKNNFTL